MWPDLIQKAKEGGLDAIETYVFWNAHEPARRSYDFTGNKDLIRFLKTIQEAGLYSVLRIGPYVCAEWNYGYIQLLFNYHIFLFSILCGFLLLFFVINFLIVILMISSGIPVWVHNLPGVEIRTANAVYMVIFHFYLRIVFLYR